MKSFLFYIAFCVACFIMGAVGSCSKAHAQEQTVYSDVVRIDYSDHAVILYACKTSYDGSVLLVWCDGQMQDVARNHSASNQTISFGGIAEPNYFHSTESESCFLNSVEKFTGNVSYTAYEIECTASTDSIYRGGFDQ
jgi:hypothetical protein